MSELSAFPEMALYQDACVVVTASLDSQRTVSLGNSIDLDSELSVYETSSATVVDEWLRCTRMRVNELKINDQACRFGGSFA
jgi:hypothetical protein